MNFLTSAVYETGTNQLNFEHPMKCDGSLGPNCVPPRDPLYIVMY